MNKPNIRFNQFTDSWESPTIDNIFELRNGYTPSKAVDAFWTNGTISWFRMEDIRAKGNILSDAFQKITPLAVKGGGLFQKNSIILATTATIGEHALLIADSLANQQFTNLKIRKSLIDSYLPYFVNYAFYKIDKWCLQNTNSGGLLSVDLKSLIKQPFYTPTLKEQISISSFFHDLECLIDSTTKKLISLKQVKSASLQSMFPQKGESVPKIRFKGFNEEWKKNKLSKFVSRITRKNKNRESNLPLTISAVDGLVSQLQYFNNIVASSNLSGYYLIKNGEFAYNKSYSNGYPFGSIKRLDKYDMGVLSTLYIVFGLKNDPFCIDSDYLATFFSTTLWHHEVAERAEEGARNHGLLNIGANDFLDINIVYPEDLVEQQKIAAYFENLDKQIYLQTQRLEKFKQIKSTCLDKMFV